MLIRLSSTIMPGKILRAKKEKNSMLDIDDEIITFPNTHLFITDTRPFSQAASEC